MNSNVHPRVQTKFLITVDGLTPCQILKRNSMLVMAFSELTAMCHRTICFFCKAICELPDLVMESMMKPMEVLWFRYWGFSELEAT